MMSSDTLNLGDCQKMLLYVANKMVHEESHLNKADSLGDNDHGTGMKIGFSSVIEKLERQIFGDLAALFKTTGLAITMSAGGASGIIFGELFRGGSPVLAEHSELSPALLADFLEQSAAAIIKRGGKQRGQKTMLDALLPAVEVAKKYIGNRAMADFLYALYSAALLGSEATAPMLPEAGRMQNLGERAKGHIDPGSISVWLILLYMYEYVRDTLNNRCT